MRTAAVRETGGCRTRMCVVDQEYWDLRVFCTVAELHSVSAAACHRLMSQSGVSNVSIASDSAMGIASSSPW